MKTTFILMIIALFSTSAFGREFTQTGVAMEPTLKAGEKVEIGFFSLFSYEPERWDVVAVKNPHEFNLMVFRIVGLPNENIRLEKDGIYINNVKVELPSRLAQAGIYYWPASAVKRNKKSGNDVYQTGEEEYFLLGDNTLKANDSRFELGMIPRASIVNKVSGNL
ncbi:signal peptidase I [Marinobacter sp. SS5-14b]|uniref:signal peptidase I n=1 Tax=Marinobacter sp. SS5-14b TaxID=3050456 RepID=UPI0026DF2D27|nr:signal peptidase I [Marinobacter sp. SS5-14b]